MAVAVNCFVIEASKNTLRGVTGALFSTYPAHLRVTQTVGRHVYKAECLLV